MTTPTEPQKQRLQELTTETDRLLAELDAIVSKTVPELNALLKERPHIVVGSASR